MKRPSIPKRKDRRMGLSAYHLKKKSPYIYSPDYRAWFRAQRARNGRALAQGAAT